MFQLAQAWQPQFDPLLPPFCTSCLQSRFEEFEASLGLNNIWLQEFMFQVLEYHLSRDLKRHLTYFSWSPRPYDVHTVPLPTTGYIGDGDHPPAPIDPSTERPTILESTAPASLTCRFCHQSHCHLSPSRVRRRLLHQSCAAPLAARGDSTIADESGDVLAEPKPVPIHVEARDTADTTDAEPAFVLHASGFANTSAPAAQALVDCQPDHDLSSNALNGSQSFPDVPERISSDLSEEPRPTPSCLPTTQEQSGVVNSHF
ncbi:hypothetical protein HPB52_010393 [Rhipicephalus sanguineus]|uniref:Uncharacterized protein n=1 Tax=Rhipicephalus sanguineus TaxID=34632 RepID=A0A9D4QDA4_RHISA|nr:hypothetical protein HPB52_010393 [Rhipicephalus sanguineus]